MSILHRGGMCHRFPRAPRCASAGRGPFCGRPFICLGRAVFGLPVHIGIHAYTYICIHPRIEAPPACLKALIAPQRRRRSALRPLAHPPRRRQLCFRPPQGPGRTRRSGVAGAGRSRTHPPSLVLSPAALGGDAPGWASVAAPAPGNPWRGCLRAGIRRHTCPRRTPSRRPRAAPARLRRGRTPATSCLPRGTLAGPSRTRNAPAQPQPRRRTGGRFRRGLGVMRARPRFRPGRGPDPSQKKM